MPGLRFELPAEENDEEEDEEHSMDKRKSKKIIDRKGTRFAQLGKAAAEPPGKPAAEPPGEALTPAHPSDSSEPDEDSQKAFEENSRIARMNAVSNQRVRRELRHDDLEAAAVKLVQLAQKNTKVLPVTLPAERSASLLGSLGSCCLVLCQSMPCVPRQDSHNQAKRHRRTAYESGFLWKLNSGMDLPSEDGKAPHSTRLKDWRRRLFFVLEPKKHLGDVAVVYLSEKENGQVHLQALLAFQGVLRSSVEELPTIAVNALGRDTKFWGMTAMKQYDVALLAPSGLAADEDYEPEVPTELFPFAITWEDSAGETQRCVLAGTMAEERQRWTLGIKTILAKMEVPQKKRSSF